MPTRHVNIHSLFTHYPHSLSALTIRSLSIHYPHSLSSLTIHSLLILQSGGSGIVFNNTPENHCEPLLPPLYESNGYSKPKCRFAGEILTLTPMGSLSILWHLAPNCPSTLSYYNSFRWIFDNSDFFLILTPTISVYVIIILTVTVATTAM